MRRYGPCNLSNLCVAMDPVILSDLCVAMGPVIYQIYVSLWAL